MTPCSCISLNVRLCAGRLKCLPLEIFGLTARGILSPRERGSDALPESVDRAHEYLRANMGLHDWVESLSSRALVLTVYCVCCSTEYVAGNTRFQLRTVEQPIKRNDTMTLRCISSRQSKAIRDIKTYYANTTKKNTARTKSL